MRLDEITQMNDISEFVNKYVRQKLPGSMHGAPAGVMFGEIINFIDLFKTAVNRYLAKHDYPLYLDSLTVVPSRGLDGGAFYPTTVDTATNAHPNGRIEIKFPQVNGDTFELHRRAIQHYLQNILSHEIGHGLQVSKDKGAVAYQRAEVQLNNGPEETKYFDYLSSHLESEMQAFSSAKDLIHISKERNLPVQKLLGLAVTDRQTFLKYLEGNPSLTSLRTMFISFYDLPENPAKSKALKRFLKKLYQYVEHLVDA